MHQQQLLALAEHYRRAAVAFEPKAPNMVDPAAMKPPRQESWPDYRHPSVRRSYRNDPWAFAAIDDYPSFTASVLGGEKKPLTEEILSKALSLPRKLTMTVTDKVPALTYFISKITYHPATQVAMVESAAHEDAGIPADPTYDKVVKTFQRPAADWQVEKEAARRQHPRAFGVELDLPSLQDRCGATKPCSPLTCDRPPHREGPHRLDHPAHGLLTWPDRRDIQYNPEMMLGPGDLRRLQEPLEDRVGELATYRASGIHDVLEGVAPQSSSISRYRKPSWCR